MRKRVIGLALWSLLLVPYLPAQAQQSSKVHRIGYLSGVDAATDSNRFEPFRQGLRDLGYIEGQNITIESRYTEGKLERLAEFAAELVRLQVDIIVTSGGVRPVRAAKNATKTIPIIMTGRGLDPVEAGLVDSLARPGGNVTGLTNVGGKLVGKRLELLKQAVRKIARVAVLYDPANPSSVIAVKEDLPVAARTLGLSIQPWAARVSNDFDTIFAALDKQRPDGLYILGGRLLSDNQNRIIGFSLRNRLPRYTRAANL